MPEYFFFLLSFSLALNSFKSYALHCIANTHKLNCPLPDKQKYEEKKVIKLKIIENYWLNAAPIYILLSIPINWKTEVLLLFFATFYFDLFRFVSLHLIQIWNDITNHTLLRSHERKSCWCWTDRYSKCCKQNWREKREKEKKRKRKIVRYYFIIVKKLVKKMREMRIDRIDTLSLIEECYQCNGLYGLFWMKGKVVLLLSLLLYTKKVRNTTNDQSK